VVPASSLKTRDDKTNFAHNIITIQPHDPDAIVSGDNIIKVQGPDAKSLISTILAHLNGATHADPR
jgi:hypothetical protein